MTIVWGLVIGWAIVNVAFLAWLVLGSWSRAGRPPFIVWITNRSEE